MAADTENLLVLGATPLPPSQESMGTGERSTRSALTLDLPSLMSRN